MKRRIYCDVVDNALSATVVFLSAARPENEDICDAPDANGITARLKYHEFTDHRSALFAPAHFVLCQAT